MDLAGRVDSVSYYDRDAAAFAARYDAVDFSAVHPLLSRYLPPVGRALDIGAGSGRDARALSGHGLSVTAVEPSQAFRNIGKSAGGAIRWLDDRLPALTALAGEEGQFAFVLCSAVLMLVRSEDLPESFLTMAGLLTEHGRLGINVRLPMPGDPTGLFFTHADAALLGAAEEAGLHCLDRTEAADALGRAPYLWRSFIFERRA